VSAHPSADLTDLASVPVDQTIDAPEALDRLQLRVAGLEVTAEGETPFPHIDGRQTFADGLLTVTREAVPDPVVFAIGDQARYLEPSALIQSDDPRIRAAAAGVVADTDHPAARARQLVAWVYASLEKRPVLSVPSAVEVLERRMGDCNEHAVLLAALCRAAGIPARIEAGLVYQRGAFYYHAWNSVWLGRWVTADALMNQLPADVTHLSLAGGELAEAVDLISVIGRIRLAVVDRR
jgi:transglutaminase-like putative cysteine protease